MNKPYAFDPLDPAGIDLVLTDEERAARSSVRQQFGRPISGFQLTQQKLADMRSSSPRALCWRCTWDGRRTGASCCPSR